MAGPAGGERGEVGREGDGTAGPATTGGLVTVPDQNGKAEEFAAEAVKYLGQGGGAETTAVWAALAQVYATLAVASAASW